MTGQPYDLLVIGAGIHGATLACRAARSGLQVALIDKSDFGAEASANSLKILHGGLRYLQQCNIARMRESICARRDGLVSLPHLARPASFIAPTGSSLKRSRAAYKAASLLNDLISADRNHDVPPSHRIPRTLVLSNRELSSLLPDSAIPGRGGMQWSDGLIENTERYTLSYVMSARESGATVMNYVRALSLLRSGNRIIGALARNEDDTEFEIHARMVVNATGGWIADLLPVPAPDPLTAARVRAYNLVVNRQWFGPFGVGLDNQSRNFFFAPWRGGTMIGTEYKSFSGNADDCRIAPDEIAAFVNDVNQLYPSAKLIVDDVTYAHVGILPALLDRNGQLTASPSSQTRILDFKQSHDIEGFLAISGVKYTTAAHWAARLSEMILQRLGVHIATRNQQPLYGSERQINADTVLRDAETSGWTISPETAAWLSSSYGARSAEVIKIAADNPARQSLVPGTVVPTAAIVHAVTFEQARHLDDVILRRTDIGSFRHPGAQALQAVSDIMAKMGNWDDARHAEELRRVQAHYLRLGSSPTRS